MVTQKAKKKTGTKKSSEQLTKQALAVTEANLARIEAQERGEKPSVDEVVPFKPSRSKSGAVSEGKGKKGAKAKAPKGEKPAKGKTAKASGAGDGKMSGLDAAAKVLADNGKPMKAKAIVEAMISKGLWKSGGKTPHATIYSAMIREIAEKGKESRIKKIGRGEFTINK